MKNPIETNSPKHSFMIIIVYILMISTIICQPSMAVTDYIFFSVNGDTTQAAMTQGDIVFWGANCDFGATVNWEIWYDVNSNSIIDLSTDVLLNSENSTDGNPMTEPDPILDGWVIGPPIYLSGEPGNYIFRAKDIVTESSVQRVITMNEMPSPPNQFTGHITIPGYAAPNSFLANRLVFSEAEIDEEGAVFAMTDENGFYTMNIGSVVTGVQFYIGASDIPGFIEPDIISAIASGTVANNDFIYSVAFDSVWGYVKDNSDDPLTFKTNVAAESNNLYKDVTTDDNGRYTIYFSEADKDFEWELSLDSRVSPLYLDCQRLNFNFDTLSSFQYDLTVLKVDDTIYAKVTENGTFPTNNYRIEAYSALLSSGSEAVSGTGSDNIVAIGVSSLDEYGWYVAINHNDDDWPVPYGLISNTEYSNVEPGDTVEFDLIEGKLVSGQLTQDPEDTPINWDDVYIACGPYGANANPDGSYAFYADTGLQYMGAYADNYICNPTWREVHVTDDTSGSGLGFILNETHCRVTGSLVGAPLPLDGSQSPVQAFTGSSGFDGYYLWIDIDHATGTYSLDLCDGEWTINPSCCFEDTDQPDPITITIGETPDTARVIDFDYRSFICGDLNDNVAVNILDITYYLAWMYKGGPAPINPRTTDINGNGVSNLLDVTYLIAYLYYQGPAPICP